MIIDTTHVWRINGQLIVADTIEKAIEVFKGIFEYPANEVDKIERVYNDGHPEISVAYMESNDEPLKFNPSNCDPGFGKALDGMVDGFRDVKCDTITLVGDGVKGEIRDACTEDYIPFEDIPIIQTNNENKTDLEPF